jgi:hypothetical protein
MENNSRRTFLATAAGGLAALAGCTDTLSGGTPGDGGSEDTDGGDGGDGADGGDGGDGGDEEDGTDSTASTDDGGESSDSTEEESGSTEDDGELPLKEPAVSVPYELGALEEDARNGGVPKDGIPSIDDPSFKDVSWGDENLDPADPVFGIELDGEPKAYPQYILVYHEVVNDTVGGQNVAVTYCPLTGSVLGFERGGVEFGVSGMLVNSNLIMYDRETDSWFPQIHPVSPKGELKGQALSEVRVTWTTWERWKRMYPETSVMTEDTGLVRNYNSDPYGSYNPPDGYYSDDGTLFGPRNENDEYHPKEVFIGARSGDGAVAFLKDTLREDRLLETSVGGTPYLAAYHKGLDSAWVYRNESEADIEATSDGYEGPDGSVYAADELPLQSVNAFDVMWFSWYGYYPETEVVA